MDDGPEKNNDGLNLKRQDSLQNDYFNPFGGNDDVVNKLNKILDVSDQKSAFQTNQSQNNSQMMNNMGFQGNQIKPISQMNHMNQFQMNQFPLN